jgi:hypothetical protein
MMTSIAMAFPPFIVVAKSAAWVDDKHAAMLVGLNVVRQEAKWRFVAHDQEEAMR